ALDFWRRTFPAREPGTFDRGHRLERFACGFPASAARLLRPAPTIRTTGRRAWRHLFNSGSIGGERGARPFHYRMPGGAANCDVEIADSKILQKAAAIACHAHGFAWA